MPRTNFSPLQHGFKFANAFVNNLARLPGFGPVTTRGRCGGMAYAALDYYFANLPVPLDSALPADGTLLANYIYTRLLNSFLTPSAVNFVSWTLLPDQASWFFKGVSGWTKETEFPKLRSQLDLGHPQVLGLIAARQIARIGDNHQVVAYGYDVDEPSGAITVYVYDNNHPDQEVRLTTGPGSSVVNSSHDGPWRGFFVQGYGPLWPDYLIENGLLRESSSAQIYLIIGGGKLPVTDSQAAALAQTGSPVRTVPDGSLSYVADAPGDGTLLRDAGSAELFVVYGGACFPVAGAQEMADLHLLESQVRAVPGGSLAAVSTIPREGTLLRPLSGDNVYLIRDGACCRLGEPQSLEARGYRWANLHTIANAALAALPPGGDLA